MNLEEQKTVYTILKTKVDTAVTLSALEKELKKFSANNKTVIQDEKYTADIIFEMYLKSRTYWSMSIGLTPMPCVPAKIL